MVRIDDAKVNIAPPSAATDWMRIVGVDLGNGNSTYPSGDNVQAARNGRLGGGVQGEHAQERLWAAQERGAGSGEADKARGTRTRRRPSWGAMLGWSPPEAKKAVAKMVEDKLAIMVKTEKDEKGMMIPFLEIVEPEDQ